MTNEEKARGNLAVETTKPDDIESSTSKNSHKPSNEDSATKGNEPTLSGYALVLVILSLCLAQFLSALDITIVATALPTIAKQLNVDNSMYTWVGSSYNLASTASTPLWAKCSDIWGRKPLLLMANATFMAGSLVAGLAQTGGMLIAGRTLQGLGGGGIIIMVTIIIADLFPLKERAKYYGLSAVVWAVSSALGPVLGGVFTQTAGWRWCFFINLPFDAISLVVLWWVLRIQTPRISTWEGLKTFDWLGATAVVGGTICFLCGLEGGASGPHGWDSAYTLGLLIGGIVLLAIFVLYELYLAKHPLIPMRIFVGRVNVGALAAASFHGFIFIAYDYFLPLYFQVVLGAIPILSGVYLFALVIPLSILSSGTGIFLKKTGKYHHAAWFGSVVMTIGTGLFIDFGTEYQIWKIIVYQIIAGVGAGPLFLSPAITLQNHLRKEDISAGMSAYTFLRSISSSISVVIGGVVLQKGLGGDSFTQQSMNTHQSRRDVPSLAESQHYVAALKNMWIFYTAMGSLVILSAFMITKSATKPEDAGPEKPELENCLSES